MSMSFLKYLANMFFIACVLNFFFNNTVFTPIYLSTFRMYTYRFMLYFIEIILNSKLVMRNLLIVVVMSCFVD
ncbi:hypothetical protein NQ314_002775 [Rhamnusium bicolor]|uniref:Uncharacterized protein n=1 Tax=Rhamnusium bicolor TaxID=1586634 RepID=A0AAV8ZNL1_9CUCU|nr:hypothetical protein NQ314_002775 [Rhamnusium bicolor]